MASPSRSPSNEPLSGCEKSTAFKWSHLVYVPNIIGYVRIGFLLKAIHQFKKKNKKKAIMYYIISYLLDAADGKAARMCNQKTDFGYWLSWKNEYSGGAHYMHWNCYLKSGNNCRCM